MQTLWSVKGGSGVTVTSVALAAGAARRDGAALLVDLCGDAPATAGISEPSGPGVWDWLATEGGSAQALDRLRVRLDDGLSLLPAGVRPRSGADASPITAERAQALIAALRESDGTVVVDAGTSFVGSVAPSHDTVVRHLAASGRSWMVIRPCYLALRRAVALDERADGVIVVVEPGRALDRRDVATVLSLPVLAAVELDPAVARGVDAGLLARRPNRALDRSLRDLR